MIIPKKLKAGDKIGILSTARKITIDELEPAIHILESWGLEVVKRRRRVVRALLFGP